MSVSHPAILRNTPKSVSRSFTSEMHAPSHPATQPPNLNAIMNPISRIFGALALGMAACSEGRAVVLSVIESDDFLHPERGFVSFRDAYEEGVGVGWDSYGHRSLVRDIDFDGDGQAEIRFTGEGGGLGVMTFAHAMVAAAPKPEDFTDPGGYAWPLASGVSVGSNAGELGLPGYPVTDWHRDGDFRGYPDITPPPLLISVGDSWGQQFGGYFPELFGIGGNNAPSFLAVRFGEEGAWHYGWVQISPTLGGSVGLIGGWGWETEVNKPILVGIIPEPAATGSWIAMSAVGVALLRRRRGERGPASSPGSGI